jgi:hypothetical protein
MPAGPTRATWTDFQAALRARESTRDWFGLATPSSHGSRPTQCSETYPVARLLGVMSVSQLPINPPGPPGVGLRHQGDAGAGRRCASAEHGLSTLLGSPALATDAELRVVVIDQLAQFMSIRVAAIFFEPLQLHLQPSYLLEKLGLLGLPFLLVLGFLAPGEQLAGAIQELLLPLAHLDRVNGVIDRDLLDRLATADRFHGDPGLELGTVGTAFSHGWGRGCLKVKLRSRKWS